MTPFVSNTDPDRSLMLERLGLTSSAELFRVIPEKFRFPKLDLPAPLSEPEVLEELFALAGKNAAPPEYLVFAGGGAYLHFVPALVDALASRGEFLTSYTPYQPEASQGTLQALFEYQSMVADLFEMETVNASHYDGAAALAEAVVMAYRAGGEERKTAVISAGLHPEYREVVATYTGPFGLKLRGKDENAWKSRDLAKLVDSDTACVVVSFPTFFGDLADYRELAALTHEKGALFIVSVDPLCLGLFDPPGRWGADIVTGEGQCLGNRLSFGGPGLGLFAVTKELVRKMPGRLAGMTADSEGVCGFVLTLNTREQHIRREKATSNICTNQGLIALRAAIYLAAMGKNGLKKAAELSYRNARYAAERLSALPGFSLVNDGPFFREFVLRCPRPAEEIVLALAEKKIIPGIPLSRYFPDRPRDLLVCVTELNRKKHIDALAEALAEFPEALG
jgi:glycine dehydrogenase subunit 1